MHITIVGALQGDTTTHHNTNENYNNNHKRNTTHHTYKYTMESQCITIALHLEISSLHITMYFETIGHIQNIR